MTANIDLAELRANASPEFIAANPQVFGMQPVSKQANNMPNNMPVQNQNSFNLQNSYKNISEATFQQRLIKALQENGWKVCEFRKARIKKGGIDVYRTPFGADGMGFPDLIAARPPRVLFIENKSDSGQASPEQIKWLLLLSKCQGVETYCWQPAHWDTIYEVIKNDR